MIEDWTNGICILIKLLEATTATVITRLSFQPKRQKKHWKSIPMAYVVNWAIRKIDFYYKQIADLYQSQ